LAQILIAKGDPAGAEVLLRESLAVRRHVFGEAHPEYAVTLNNLANAIEAQGRLNEAQSMFEDAVRIARPQLTDQHPRVATMMLNAARVQI
ncbi:tetratricopeptide repeat protein, partial [Escherichia marmotae]|nr:tetratricopeptide repeat protein [Escherichia marmotae]